MAMARRKLAWSYDILSLAIVHCTDETIICSSTENHFLLSLNWMKISHSVRILLLLECKYNIL